MPISFLFYLYNGLTFSQFILCQSIYNLTCLIAKISMGAVGDIFPKKYVLIFSYFLFMLRVILWINFSSFWIILTGEILYGLFKAFYRGNVDSYIYEYLETTSNTEKIIKKYGKLSFFNSIGSATSCIIGVILYKFIGFKGILCLELVTQIIAISCLFFLPNLHTPKKKYNISETAKYYLKVFCDSIKSICKNPKLNYNVFYSSALSGLTSVFVWNFQPLLKLSSAPVFLFGVISFINQCLRGLGGFFAKNIIKKITSNKYLYFIEYFMVITSFVLLIIGYQTKNYILTTLFLIIICIAIFMFVIFGIFNTAKIHENTDDYKRASTSSINVFFEDFSSFLLLLIFKFLYDAVGINYSLFIYALIFTILLLPNLKRIKIIAQ